MSRSSPAPRCSASTAHSTVPRAVSIVPARVRTRPPSVSIATTTACEPSFSASAVISEGRASAAELTEILSAPAERSGVRVHAERPDPAADGERDRELFGDPPDDPDERVSLLEGCLHVQEDELVGAAVRVGGTELDRVADIPEPLEPDSLDDAACGDVEARRIEARERHRSPSPRQALRSRKRAPAGPLFSGWNCTPRNDPEAMPGRRSLRSGRHGERRLGGMGECAK